jgi:succinate dehydrogenase / fumarate reductase cytochrome b subunit
MNITTLLTSSVGKKFVMAVTGLALFGFAFGHMVGNLQVFLGFEALNRYAAFLQGLGELLWVVRLGLLAMVALHIWMAVSLHFANKAARPIAYEKQELVAASYASRTMIWSGLIVAAFIVYHLMHYTACIQAVNLTGRDFSALEDVKGRHDVYAMVVLGFKQPVVAGFYVLAVFLLCLHLSHGVSALFQSLGLKSPANKCAIECGAKLVSWFIFAGYVSVPIAVQLGLGTSYLAELTQKGLLK